MVETRLGLQPILLWRPYGRTTLKPELVGESLDLTLCVPLMIVFRGLMSLLG